MRHVCCSEALSPAVVAAALRHRNRLFLQASVHLQNITLGLYFSGSLSLCFVHNNCEYLPQLFLKTLLNISGKFALNFPTEALNMSHSSLTVVVYLDFVRVKDELWSFTSSHHQPVTEGGRSRTRFPILDSCTQTAGTFARGSA